MIITPFLVGAALTEARPETRDRPLVSVCAKGAFSVNSHIQRQGRV